MYSVLHRYNKQVEKIIQFDDLKLIPGASHNMKLSFLAEFILFKTTLQSGLLSSNLINVF